MNTWNYIDDYKWNDLDNTVWSSIAQNQTSDKPFEIDLSKINEQPQLYVCKPDNNFTTVGILNDAFNIKLNLKLSQINELNFSIFTDIEINHKLVRNPNYDLLKFRYLIRFEYGTYKEYFIINVPEDVSDESGYIKNITCYSLAYSLNNEIINGYKSNSSINATQVLNDILINTAWSIGDIDVSFDIMYRQFDISGKSALDAIYDIANTFSAVVVFDSMNYKIHLRKIEDGLDRGLVFDYGKYIENISNKINPDNFATELYIYGKDNLTISTANVNGGPYLQNFMFYIYPFERDENRNVLKQSDYMSDNLCHAILDYNILLESKDGEYNVLYNNKITYQDSINTKTTELIDLRTEMFIILDSLDLAQANNLPISELILQRNNKQIEIDNKLKEINSILFDINITNGCIADGSINITIDDKIIDIPLTLGDTINNVATKIINYINNKYYNYNNKFPLIPTLKCSVIDNVISIIYFTTKDKIDFNVTFADTDSTGVICSIGNRTNNGLENHISDINNQITTLVNLLSMESNFSSDEILELKRSFIIKKEIRNEYISDAKELLIWGKKEFEKYYYPPTVIEIGIVDLFSCIDIGCQYDRDKLQLAETVRVKYDKFNLDIKAKIIEITYDFENNNIDLVISNIKEISKDKDKFVKMLNQSINSGMIVEANKDSWNDISTTNNQLANVIDKLSGNIKNELLLNVNENVEISKRGIYITSPDNPLNVLIIQNGVLAISNDGGNTWGHCISTSGILGQKIIGKLLCGLNLEIDASDAEGNKTFIVNQNGVQIFNMIMSLIRSDKKTQILLDPTSGFKIQKNTGTVDIPVWTDIFYINNDGDLISTGNIQIGTGNSIFKADDQGIYLGNNEFNSAPFRVDLSGNAYMSKLTAENADIKGNIDCDSLKISGTNILDELNQKINGTYLADSSVGASKIKTNELIVGTNITMGANATITWGQVTSQPFIPSSASDVGALSTTWANGLSSLPTFITSTKITQTTIESPNIIGGTITSNTTIDVGTDAKIGRNLILTAEEFSTILWKDSLNVVYGKIEMDSPAKSLSIYGTNSTQIGTTGKNTYIDGNVIFENPVVAVLG